VWVEYPDIEGVCSKLGAKRTSFLSDGSGGKFYTLPVIHDSRTNAVVSDSWDIAEYLDATYPDTPRLFPKGSQALQHSFTSAFKLQLDVIWFFIMPAAFDRLNEASKPYFRAAREGFFGKKLEDFSPVGPVRDEQWKAVKGALDVVDYWLARGVPGQAYIAGDSPSFVDFVVGARFMWMKLVFGEDSQLWKEISSWHGGRWGMMLKSVSKYETVV
jgi:glutathione S-transferase